MSLLSARPAVAGVGLGWPLVASAAALLVALPILAIFWIGLFPTENIWPHLAATVLPTYVTTTLVLMVTVGIGVVIIGTGTAWLVAMCRFPGRRLFEWALLLPLAVPAYIIAYTYTDLLEFAGPVQETLRDLFDWRGRRDYWFPEIRSVGGAASMMTLVLYPYVYAVSRAAFLEQSVCVLEVSRTLGRGPWRAFFEVALPLARPAIVVGLTLAMMEVLNDFGTIDFFAVKTLTAGVFDVWLGMGNPGGAAQIALVMLGFVAVLLWLERQGRTHQRFHHTSTHIRPLPGHKLEGGRAWAASLACALPVGLGFAVPTIVLARYAYERFDESWTPEFVTLTLHSLELAATSAVVVVLLAIIIAYALRLAPRPYMTAVARLSGLGYAVPGAVLAIGVILPASSLDHAVDAASERWFGVSTGLLFSGSVAALIFAYCVRFMAAALGPVEAGLAKVTTNMDQAARSLGHGPAATLRDVHWPLIKGSALTGGILVFVDALKELPMTLILRPFNFETLATHVYQYASDELLEESALAALVIVLAGLLPVILINKVIAGARAGGEIPQD